MIGDYRISLGIGEELGAEMESLEWLTYDKILLFDQYLRRRVWDAFVSDTHCLCLAYVRSGLAVQL